MTDLQNYLNMVKRRGYFAEITYGDVTIVTIDATNGLISAWFEPQSGNFLYFKISERK